MKKKLISLFIAAVVTLTSLSGCGEEEVYRLIKVEATDGDVDVVRGVQTYDAFEGMELVSKDNVNVGESSSLAMLVDQDKHIAAYENTKFTITAVGDENKGSVTIDLVEGMGVFNIEKKLSENSSFVVNTPNATLSVRGTTFTAVYAPEEKITVLEVESGVVHVDSSEGSAEDVIAGQARAIENNRITEISSLDDFITAAALRRPGPSAKYKIGKEEYSTAETTLDLSGKDLTNEDLDNLKYFTNLQYLYLNSNKGITDLTPVKDLKKLILLRADSCSITDLSPLAELKKLETLTFSFNKKLADLTPLQGLTNLKILYLESNDITDISALKGLTSLEKLIIYMNKIPDISPLKGLTNLNELNIDLESASDVEILKELKSLKKLTINTYSKFTIDQAELKNELPNCNITVSR